MVGRLGQGLAPFPAATEVPLAAGSPTAHRFQEALCDFRLALAQLRDNTAIDYTQLGLRFKLHAWEVSLHREVWPAGALGVLSAGGPGGPSGPVLWVPSSSHCHRWGRVDRGSLWPLFHPEEAGG